MMTINAIGRITKDVELKQSEKSGCIYANFSLAVNEFFGGKEKTTFFDCVVFGTEAERLVKAKAKKGSLIQVTGKFGTSEFPRNNGEKGYSLNITILAWSYIPGTSQKDANGANGNNGTTVENAEPPNQPPEAPPTEDSEVGQVETLDLDDENKAF
jgi:single-strand DNA-binding protein